MHEAGKCVLCGMRGIDEDRDYQEVRGFVRKREQGGANQIRLRQPVPDRWAHATCVDNEAHGVSARQQAMV